MKIPFTPKRLADEDSAILRRCAVWQALDGGGAVRAQRRQHARHWAVLWRSSVAGAALRSSLWTDKKVPVSWLSCFWAR